MQINTVRGYTASDCTGSRWVKIPRKTRPGRPAEKPRMHAEDICQIRKSVFHTGFLFSSVNFRFQYDFCRGLKGEIYSLMDKNLTPEQAEIFQFARNGHNILVTGQAGTGKSRVVNVIRDDCRQRGLKVAVICSSGIACQVYDRGVASTVHSYYGLGAADMPSGQLIDRATSNVAVSGKLKTVDVVIWDEASMSSARMLEFVNALHHRLCEDESEEESLPFTGKQFIIVGEFLQLRPVPSSFDSGSFMLLSRVFRYAITHRFQFTKVLRQSDTVNTMFMNCLSDVRLGTCSQETASFIEELSRSLDPQLKSMGTHIFFKKNSVFLFNLSALEELDGELLRFDATFDGKGEKMNFQGEKTLFLKRDCKVMLVWNRSDTLKNGSMGTFKSVDGNKLLVYFEKVGTVAIERATGFKGIARVRKLEV